MRNIGPDIAREVEGAYGLAEGWADTPWDLLPDELQSGPIRVPGVPEDSDEAPITIERSLLSLQIVCGAIVNALSMSESGRGIAEAVQRALSSEAVPKRLRTKGPIGYVLSGLAAQAIAEADQVQEDPSKGRGGSSKGLPRTAASKRQEAGRS
jgi:hypothetical protein